MAYPKLTPIVATGSDAPRYIGDRFADIINVKDFGAKGDGIADDTEAINSAIAAGYGKTVFIPAGVYKIMSMIIFRSNTRVVGAGKANTIIRRGYEYWYDEDHGAHAQFAEIDRGVGIDSGYIEDVSIEDMTFDAKGADYPTIAITILQCSGIAPIRHVNISGCRFLDVVSSHAVDLIRASDVKIVDCDFLGFLHFDRGDGIYREAIQLDVGGVDDDADRTRGITIDRCRFGASENLGPYNTAIGNHGFADTSSTQNQNHIKITNCKFEKFETNPYANVITMYVFNHVLIENNHFDECGCILIKNRYGSVEGANPCSDIKIIGNHLDGGSHFNHPIYIASTNTPSTGATRMSAAIKNLEIAYNVIENYNGQCVRFDSEGTINFNMHDNHIYNVQGATVSMGGVVRGFNVKNNYFESCGFMWFSGYSSGSDISIDYYTAYQICNNVFVNPYNKVKVVYFNYGVRGAIIKDNVVIDTNTSRTESVFTFAASCIGGVCKDNVIFLSSSNVTTPISSSSPGVTSSGNRIYVNGVEQN